MNKNLVATYMACALITVAGLAIIDSAHITYPLSIVTSARSSELAVVGEGKAEAKPDTATISLGITINKTPTAQKAQEGIDSVHSAIVTALKSLNIPEADITTSGYSIQPNYSYDASTQRIDGYNGTAQVTIKTHTLSQVDPIIGATMQAGANQVNTVAFSIDNPQELRAQARTKAIENAKAEAEKLSDELGISLGKITNIVESNGSYPMPLYAETYAGDSIMTKSSAPEIQPGTETFSSTVTLYFEKE